MVHQVRHAAHVSHVSSEGDQVQDLQWPARSAPLLLLFFPTLVLLLRRILILCLGLVSISGETLVDFAHYRLSRTGERADAYGTDHPGQRGDQRVHRALGSRSEDLADWLSSAARCR